VENNYQESEGAVNKALSDPHTSTSGLERRTSNQAAMETPVHEL